MDQLTQTCDDLFAAGSESTGNSISYAILHMLRNPECQEKVQQELDDVIGRNSLPSYKDRQRLVDEGSMLLFFRMNTDLHS